MNENASAPGLVTFMVAVSAPSSRVMVCVTLKSLSHIALVYSEGSRVMVMDGASPSFVSVSAQSTLRAKPCTWMSPGPNCGQQCGRPPEMGLDLSNTASGRTYSTSRPFLTKEVTTPPNRYAVAVSPFFAVRRTAGRSPVPAISSTEDAATRTGPRDARRAPARRAPETRSAGATREAVQEAILVGAKWTSKRGASGSVATRTADRENVTQQRGGDSQSTFNPRLGG